MTRPGRPFPAQRPFSTTASSECCGTGTVSSSPQCCSSSRHPLSLSTTSFTFSSKPWPQHPLWPCTAISQRYCAALTCNWASAVFLSDCCSRTWWVTCHCWYLLVHRWWTNPWHLVPMSLIKSLWNVALEQQVETSLTWARLGLW